MASREALRCSEALAKMMASSNEEGCCSATSVSSGSPNPVMKSWGTQHGQLTNWAIGEGQPKSRVHQLHKLRPCRAATVEFHVMEPQLGVIQEIECGEGHPFVLQRLAHEEVTLALVEPRKRIACAVVL
jgi:hypothetical protein